MLRSPPSGALSFALLAATTLAVAQPTSIQPVGSDRLADPIRLSAADGPIDTSVGHAAPFVADFDGDGVRDLLVGQFGGGLLWIFRNEGTDATPRLASRQKFMAGGAIGKVPTG